jgi:two-component system cell cycle response regulator DivK
VNQPRILIVEDDRMNARFFEITLTRRGQFSVCTTESVPDILDRARRGEVDLVIMDVSLPNSSYEGKKVDGLAIARLLKSDPLTRRIPILLATAHAMKGDRESFLRASLADDYISKPITDPQALIDKVRSLLEPPEPAS